MSIHGRTVAILLTCWLLLGAVGCIAYSREVRREVTPGDSIPVTARGQWEFDQEWRCGESRRFDLDRERRAFDRSRDEWGERGWELTGISVVPLPATPDAPEQICLVGSYRRWVAVDS